MLKFEIVAKMLNLCLKFLLFFFILMKYMATDGRFLHFKNVSSNFFN